MGRYYKPYYDAENPSTVVGADDYTCTVGSLSLENINSSLFDFSFLTEEGEGGVLGNVDEMLKKVECYTTNTSSYDVDGKNNYQEAYDELQNDIKDLKGELDTLKSTLEGQVADIESEISSNYNWAYTASFTDNSWGKRG